MSAPMLLLFAVHPPSPYKLDEHKNEYRRAYAVVRIRKPPRRANSHGTKSEDDDDQEHRKDLQPYVIPDSHTGS